MKRPRVPAVLVAALALTAGCTSVIRDPVAVAVGAAGTPVASAGAGLGPRSPDGGYWPRTVQLGQSSDLGQVVLDGQGFTLYRFDRDAADPPRSSCVDSCATKWPPVLANESIKFQNLDPGKIGVATRGDGTRQVTLGGRPLYRFSADQVPGQANGEGVDGQWFVAAPDGAKAAAN